MKKYENVYMGMDEKTGKYIDFSDKLDIVFFGNPYSSMAHPYHFIWEILKKNILTCYQNYGYNTVLWGYFDGAKIVNFSLVNGKR